MDASRVYRKTDKGQREIATRAAGLPARGRSLLIMVDGRHRLDRLLGDGNSFADALPLFDQLLEQGFIEPVAAAASDARASEAAVAEDPAALAAAKAFGARYVTELLGPDAAPLAARIEAARSRAELLGQLERTRDLILGVRGAEAAGKFWRDASTLAGT